MPDGGEVLKTIKSGSKTGKVLSSSYEGYKASTESLGAGIFSNLHYVMNKLHLFNIFSKQNIKIQPSKDVPFYVM